MTNEKTTDSAVSALSAWLAGFTEQQVADWRAYEKVRKGGRWNMFDPNARRATKLDGERYAFVMKNFSRLKDIAELTVNAELRGAAPEQK